MEEKRKKIGEVLIENGLIDRFQLKTALTHQAKWGRALGETLIELGFITENSLMKALSRFFNVPSINVVTMEIPKAVLALVPVALAERHNLLPLAVKMVQQKKRLVLAMSDPTNFQVIDELQFKTGMKILPMVGSISGIQQAIRKFYYQEKDLIPFVDDRSGVSMVLPNDQESRIQIIRGGDEDSVPISMLDTDTHKLKTEQLADALAKKNILNSRQQLTIKESGDPFALLCQFLVDKNILTVEELAQLFSTSKKN